ncbi:MAG: MBL fold metallo-hydrolase [Spirulinaceae cyanobacterium]
MPTSSSEEPTSQPPQISQHPTKTAKAPRLVKPGIFAFPPNRDTLGATSYFIVEKLGNILLDCPPWNSINQEFVQNKGGVRWLFVTHRNGMAKVPEIQAFFHCEVIIQEQEAYLLPEVEVTSFQDEYVFAPNFLALWTPGYTPGSSCLYYNALGGVLFSGRHLLPNTQGQLSPLHTPKTFHWPRQLRNVQKLRDRFSPQTLAYICPGANTGFLRGNSCIEDGYEHLAELDLEVI